MRARVWSNTALAAVLLVLVFVPRLAHLDRSINLDACQFWLSRCVDFYAALAHGDLADTGKITHPGVTVRILSGAFLTAGSLLRFGTLEVYAHARQLLYWAVLPLSVATGIGLFALAGLLRRSAPTARGFAALALAFLAIDPVLLVHSRQLHLDGLNAVLMLLCLVTSFAALRGGDRRLALASAVFAGLALLTRSSSLALLPFVGGATLLAGRSASRSAVVERLRSFAGWLAVAGIVFVLLWPAMWVAPLQTLRSYSGEVGGAYRARHEVLEIERPMLQGTPAQRFSPRFFIDLATYHSTTVLALFVVGAAIVALRVFRRRATELEWLLAYLALFGVFFLNGMSFFRKATTIDLGFRYVLVVFVIVQLLAAYGFWVCAQRALRALPKHRFAALALLGLLGCAGLVEGGRVLRLHPYYQTWHNEWIEPDFYGWGEGLELVGGYLNRKPGARELVVASDFKCCLDQYFDGRVVPLAAVGAGTDAEVDYVVLYNSQVRRGLYPEITQHYLGAGTKPEFVAVLNGVEYAWLYPVTDALALAAQRGAGR